MTSDVNKASFIFTETGIFNKCFNANLYSDKLHWVIIAFIFTLNNPSAHKFCFLTVGILYCTYMILLHFILTQFRLK